MKVVFAFLAESATATPAGRLDAVGVGVDTIWAATFPTAPVRMVLVCRIEASPRECGALHQVRLEFIDADGRPVAQSWELAWRPERSTTEPHRTVSITLVVRHASSDG